MSRNVRNFGATGDGVADDTAAIRHALEEAGGPLFFPVGTYRILEPIVIDLAKTGACGVQGDASATVVMAGAGPAFRMVGHHNGTGDPGSVTPAVWKDERMPLVQNIAVEGAHVEADGFELEGTMQARFDGVIIRNVRHGIHLVRRNRNVLISNCHIYKNTGVGVFFDGVNLHQVNIASSHISYNRLGGIRIERSEIRNLQITGNDIEYNNARSHKGLPSEPTAEIWIDTTAEKATVNEVTIASNTIQATNSKGGANIRILEGPEHSDRPPGLWSISGNVIGSQETNVHLTRCHGVVISGNSIYSSTHRNLLVEESDLVNVSGNNFRRHTTAYGTGVRFVKSHHCQLSGNQFQDESEAGQKNGASLLELDDCEWMNVSACQFVDGVPYGIDVNNCRHVRISNCMVNEPRAVKKATSSVRVRGGEDVEFLGNLFESG